MDREQIERLAMDSAAKELNEDVKALLQEYLTEHPETKEWFLEIENIYKNTQNAFDSKITSIKQPAKNKHLLKFNWLPVMRFAAAIVISACIGAAAGRWSKQTAPKQKQVAAVTATSSSKKTGFNLDDIGEGFWRDKIAAMVNPSPVREHREDNSGHSLMEQYRQYLKEKNHE